jgi:Zn-dependent protease
MSLPGIPDHFMLGLSVPVIITRIITLLVAFTTHEFAHAFTANAFGDSTARDQGRLTLNPLAHLDLVGSLLLLIGGFGWAKPVPVNPYTLQRRSPAALMWVSLAGPFSNFLLAILAAIPLRLGLLLYSESGSIFPSLYNFTYEFMAINLLLMLFNLIPIAPLDGDKIAEYFLPPAGVRILETIRPYGWVILIVMLFVLPRLGLDVFSWIIGQPLHNLIRLLLGVPL